MDTEKDPSKRIRKYLKLRAKIQAKGDLKEEAEIVNVLGELHTEIEDHEEALNLHKEELGLCQATEDSIGQAVAHRKIGECFASLCNYTKAIKHQNLHLELAKLVGDLPEQQRAFTTIGRTYLIEGEESHNNGSSEDSKLLFQRAESAFRSSIRLTQTIQEQKFLPDKEIQEMRVRSIANLALTYHYLAIKSKTNGNHYEEQCVTLFQKAITLSDKHMLTAQLHRTRISFTMFYRSRSKTDLALTHAQDALRCAKVSKNVAWQFEALSVLGDIFLYRGDCKNAKRMLKRGYRLTKCPDKKSEIREKLKAVVKIYHLTLKTEDTSLTSMEKFSVHEKIADKYCDLEYFQAAVCHYKYQETMLSALPEITEKQIASVYYSLALTSSDLNDHEAAIEYYKKELEYRKEPRELAKTWSQIALCMEKLDKPTEDIEEYYKKTVKYAEETSDSKLQLKTLNLLLDLHVKSKSLSASDTRQSIADLELRSGLLVTEAEEESQEIGGGGEGCSTSEIETNVDNEEDSEEMLERELENISSDDSDNEECSRRSKTAKMNWKKKLNEKGETALHRACIDGHLKRVQLLLEQGHPVNIPDYAGWIPLHEACNHGYTEIVRILLSHGANVNYYSTKCGGTTPAQDAATNGHVGIVDLLLQNDADVNIKNCEGETLLSTLESWYKRTKNELDSYEEENYQKLYETVAEKSSSDSQRTKPQNSAFPCLMGNNFEPSSDLFHSESLSQTNQRRGMTQGSENNVSQQISSVRMNETGTPSGETGFDHAQQDFPFNDSQILPALTPRPRRPEANSFFEVEEIAPSGVDEYREALASLGGSDSIVKHANVNRLSQGRKRPSSDGPDLHQIPLLPEEDYSSDDWLVDVQEISGCSGVMSNPPKRQKKMLRGTGPVQTTLTKSSGWQHTNFKKKSKANSSRGIVSAFLDSDSIRNSNSKRFKTTKIKDFLAAQGNSSDHLEEAGIVDHPEIIPSSFSNHRTKQDALSSISSVIPSSLPSQQPQVQQNLRVRVKINGKMFLVGVPGRMKTIGWLCERSSLVYKQATGLQPHLALYTGSSTNEEDLCLLSHDDLVCDVLQSNEHVTAKVESWKTISLTQKYAEACAEQKQAILPQVMNACQQSLSTGRLEVKNLGLLSCQMKPLVASIQQQEITSLALPGNQLNDGGMTSLCESLCKQMNLATTPSSFSTPSLTEINMRCCNLTHNGLKRLAQAAKAGALENLQDINISDNRLGDFCCEELSEIISCCKKLRSLHAASCRFTQKLFQANYQSFKNAFQESQCLLSVDFSRNMFGSTGVELLLKCFNNQLISVNLSRVVSVTNNSLFARHVLTYLNHDNCKLQYLYMSSNQLSVNQLKFFINGLKPIQNLPLHSLDISKNAIEEGDEMFIKNGLASIKSMVEISVSRSHHKWTDIMKDVVHDTALMCEELQFETFHQDLIST